jgi:hypothetical protein
MMLSMWRLERRYWSRPPMPQQTVQHSSYQSSNSPPMANSIVSALDRWFLHLPPDCIPWLPSGPNNPNRQLHLLINDAFVSQNYIGWGHFLRGRLSLHWKRCIAEYYKVCQPGDKFNPNLWMQKMINMLWQVFLTIWQTWNGELYGKDYEEQCAIALAMTRDEVSRIYEEAKHYVNDAEKLNRFSSGPSCILMHTWQQLR